jgi:putative two-component system response regulator
MAETSVSSALACSPTPPTVLVVDDDQVATTFLTRLLGSEGYTVKVAHDGPSALECIAKDPPDVVLLKVMIPGLDGFEICRRVKREPATRLTPVMLMTALSAKEHRIAGLEAGADAVFANPVDTEELLTRVRALARVKRYTDDLDAAASIVMTLADMIESRDGYKEGHCHRIANYATALGRGLQLGSKDLQALHRGGFLHDIGMLAIPEPVLRKSGHLNPEEYELVKSHTVIGDSLIESLRSLQAVRPIIRHHHERFDGSGYPDGLQGDAIPLLAQIIGLVDAYDAVTTQRPYQQAKPINEAIGVLMQQVERGWRRRDLAERFIGLIQAGKVAV